MELAPKEEAEKMSKGCSSLKDAIHQSDMMSVLKNNNPGDEIYWKLVSIELHKLKSNNYENIRRHI